MKRILAIIMFFAATYVSAENFNTLTMQGVANTATPIYGVSVEILSAGNVVGTAPNVDIVPDPTSKVFIIKIYVENPQVFQVGSDYAIRLSKPGETFPLISLNAIPFALTVRGDTQTGNQNIFGAYGNVGIGTDTPAYRLVVSSAGSNLLWVSSSGVNATTITASGYISAARYQIGGSTVIAILPGNSSLGIGAEAGRINIGGNNTFIGDRVGYSNTTAGGNTFIGAYSGYMNITGGGNIFVGSQTGYYSGYSSSGGNDNTFIGNRAGWMNGSGSDNTSIGNMAGMYNAGDMNVFIGLMSGVRSETGRANTFIGIGSGYDNLSGDGNTFLGFMAGGNNTTGSNNIAIGNYPSLSSPAANNELSIGDVLFGDLSAKTVGISTRVPQAALDVVSTGTKNTEFAQIWRDQGGTIISSISATGVLMANRFVGNGSGLTNLPVSGDNLGTHMAAQTLDMAGFDINNIGSITANSQITTYGTMTVVGNAFSVGGSVFSVGGGNIGIGTAVPGYKVDVQGGDINTSANLRESGTALSTKYAYVGGSNANGTWPINITGTASGAAPTGAAGGDLSGFYPNPSIASLPVGLDGSGLLKISSVALSGFYSDVSVRSRLGLALGTDVQAYDADLADLADGKLTVSKIDAGSLPSDVIASSVAVNVVYPSAVKPGVYAISITGTASAAAPAGAAGGHLNGFYPNPEIAFLPAISGTNLISLTAANISAGSLGSNVMASSVAASGFYNSVMVRGNLGLAIGADVQGYDADLADLADGKLTASKIDTGSLPLDVIASSIAVGGVQDASIVNVSGYKVAGNISGNAANITGNLAPSQVAVGALNSVTSLTASSVTVIGLGVGAAQLRLANSIVISSEARVAMGGGVNISSNVYIVGFSSAAKYYGDGSALTGISSSGGGDVYKKSTQTFTGSNTFIGNVTIGKHATQANDIVATLTTADFGKTITVANASDVVLTLPLVSVFDIGAQITFIRLGTGKLTIAASGSATINDSGANGTIYNSSVSEVYSTITLHLATTGKWLVLGGNGSWTTTN